VVQLSPPQVIAPVQLFCPLQRISEAEAPLVMLPLHVLSPQVTWQLVPEQRIGPPHALPPPHVTLQLAEREQSTPAAQPPAPQSTLHGCSRGQLMTVRHEPCERQSKTQPED
jgi:hypothetical protein